MDSSEDFGPGFGWVSFFGVFFFFFSSFTPKEHLREMETYGHMKIYMLNVYSSTVHSS